MKVLKVAPTYKKKESFERGAEVNSRKLLRDYNRLVDEYNSLLEDREAESYFLQGILESSPYSKNTKAIRGFNISIYLKDDLNLNLAEEAIADLLNCLGYEIIYEQEKYSSWWKRITTRGKNLLSEKEVQDDLKKSNNTSKTQPLEDLNLKMILN